MDGKKFLIGGTICADSAETWAFEDVTPSQVRAFMSKLEPGEGVEFEISSPGGNCMAGLAIANLVREASKNGHRTCAHVVGIAASMASVVACACDDIRIDESAFMMIHNPWTVAQGDADDLRKEADVLDQIRASILSFYRGKFDRDDEAIVAMMDEETWFTGGEAETFGFKADVIPSAEPLRAAACCREVPSFARTPEAAGALLRLGRHEEPAQVAEPEAAPAQNAEMVTRDECEMRVRGMQSAMGKQVQALQAELTLAKKQHADEMAALRKDFERQRDALNVELAEAKAEATRLVERAENAEGELRATASALEESKNALAALNANVNRPSSRPREAVNAREVLASLPMNERAAYYLAHKDEIDNH